MDRHQRLLSYQTQESDQIGEPTGVESLSFSEVAVADVILTALFCSEETYEL